LFVILPGSAILHAFLRFVALRGGISLQGKDFIQWQAPSLKKMQYGERQRPEFLLAIA
jgi:hypothetical protein